MLPWVLCAVLAAAVLVLLVRLRLIHKSLDELGRDLGEWLDADTNVLLSVSCRDRQVRRLASRLNEQLRLLRGQRRRYLDGDRALKETVAGISHDLRTPLTALRGYLELLEREDRSEAAERYLAAVEDRAQALEQLTEELFRYSLGAAGETLRPQSVSLNRALEDSVAAFYAVLKDRGIRPVIRMPETQVMRALDSAALSRVLGNLLHNAVKYSDGDLEIALSEGGELLFSNSASTLDPVQVGRLFDRYFSVESARGSAGLGLAIARTLTQQMGGTIDAAYAEGILTLRLRFPAETAPQRS